MSKWIHELDEGQAIKKLNIKEAIEIITDAWDSVKQNTIKNCWKNTGILPVETILAVSNEMEIDEIDDSMANLVSALNSLKIIDPSVNITAEEYVDADNGLTCTDLPTEEEIFEEFLVAEGALQQIQTDTEDSSEGEEETISVQVGRKALEIAKRFLEQRTFTTENDIKYMRNIIRRLDESVEKSKRQALLTEFIIDQ